MKPWADVEADPAFKALSPTEQYEAQEQYFNEVVAPNVPSEEQDGVKGQFFGEFGRRIIPKDTGQSLGQAMVMSAGRGAMSVPEGIVSGVGAVSSLIPGMEDNLFSRMGGGLEKWTEDTLPINPTLEDSWSVKIPGAVGQGAGFLGLTLGTAGLGATPAMASRLGLGAAAAMGAEQGEERADQYAIKDPWKRAAMVLGSAAVEGVTERLGGIGAPKPTEALLGALKSATRPGNVLTRFAKTAGEEGLEEVIAGQAGDILTKGLVEEDPNRPGFAINGATMPPDILSMKNLYNRLEEGALGAVGGAVFAGSEALGSRTPVNEALSLRMQARSVLNDLQSKETLTPEEQSTLERMQAEDANVSAWLARQGEDTVRPELDEIINNPETPEPQREEAIQYASLIDNARAVESAPDATPEEKQAAHQAVESHPLNNLNPLARTRQDTAISGTIDEKIKALRTKVEEQTKKPTDQLDQIIQQEVTNIAEAAPETAQVVQDIINTPTEQSNAIQEQISTESFLQPTGSELELPAVGEGDPQEQTSPEQGVQSQEEVAVTQPILEAVPPVSPQVTVHAINGTELAQESRPASQELLADLVNQKKTYTQLLNCLNS